MADYITVVDSSVDPDAPLTSDLMYRLRDNPIAIAEGSIGAPKVRSEALRLTREAADRTSDGVLFTLTGIDRISSFMVSSYVYIVSGSAGGASVRYRTSTDGGSTWGGYTIFNTASISGAGDNSSTKFGYIDTPNVNAIQIALTSTSGSSSGASVSALGVRSLS